MDTLIKLAELYRLISAASDEEVSILLGYAQNLVKPAPQAREQKG